MLLLYHIFRYFSTYLSIQPKDLWEIAAKEIANRPGVLVFDDVVINKSRSQKMELVNRQYSGEESA